MAKYKLLKMNTGDRGEFVYTIMMDMGGGEYSSSRPIRYYKTKSRALKEIKKRNKR